MEASDHQQQADGGGLHTPLQAHQLQPWTAIVMTCISGFAAVLGGLGVVIGGSPSNAVQGHLLSFAAGIMLYISYGDLMPHAMGGMEGGGRGLLQQQRRYSGLPS